ncbi:P1 family peptidase [candidate division KSB1 bacterium]|nr:P1 family peptidase [candidate division KSB1 bacterium]
MPSICDVPGIRVGHAQSEKAKTGCTVILPDREVVAGVDVRGSAPGTHELELLKPVRLVQRIHAILLTGGSAFGLDAAGGIQQYLEEHGIGFDTGIIKVPIVPAAVIFDLGVGDPKVRPDKKMGYKAAKNATSSDTRTGLVGAGIGATVGKLLGTEHCMAGGIGMWSTTFSDGTIIGALVVVNAFGNIYDPWRHQFIAGARVSSDQPVIDPVQNIDDWILPFSPGSNTTLGVIATNVALSKEECTKIAQMAHDGFARTIIPAHTQVDGDIIFAISTEEKQAGQTDFLKIGIGAADVMARAVIQAVN